MKNKNIIYLFAIALFLLPFIKWAESQVVINEYSVSNLSSFVDNYGEYEDWIELYNAGLTTTSLGGYCLSDDTAEPEKWEFPFGATIAAGGHLIVWATGRNEATGGNYHSSFRLSQTKDPPEFIVLTDPVGNIVEEHQLQVTQKEHSRGRETDGAASWRIFTNPTPENSNNTATSYLRYTNKPVMSDTAGFYASGLVVTITTDEPNATIHYTTNGMPPTPSSPVCSLPVSIDNTTLLQARVISDDPEALPGLIEFNTFFIGEEHDLPVMSGSGDGLLTLLNGNSSLRPFGTIEYFNKDGIRTTYGYGEYNEHGQDSWVHDQRSIDYIMRDECGYNYALQEELIELTDRDEFQRVILRASGDDNYPGIDTSAHTRDFIIQNLAEKIGMNLDVRKGNRCVLYANGNYWGIYAMREKVNDHDFTSYYYDQGKYELQFLMLWGGTWAQYGGQQAFDDWNALHDFIKNQDMGDLENYNYVASQYDITSLVDYVHINSYVVCSDWINWNVGWWRGLNPDGGHLKWGYILWDEDATFGHYINYTGVPGQNPYVSPCFPEGITADPEEHIVALNELRESPVFEQYYVSRYVDLINSGLHIDYVIPWVDSLAAIIETEMPRHTNRWGGSFQQWQNNVQKIKNFVTTRFEILNQGFINCWNLNGPYPITLKTEPEGMGEIHLNSLILTDFPWQGNYFGGINTKLKAVPANLQYEFDYWELNNHNVLPSDTVQNVFLDLTTSDTIVAHFKQKVYVDSLVINEINYNSAGNFDVEDWVELYNPHDYPLDIAGWFFRDGNDEHEFVFPGGTIVEPHGYLVLARDTAAFHDHFPDVENYLGQFDFGFSAGGELLRLFDASSVLVDTVSYDDDEPWPTEPDGDGPTLELIDPGLDNALPESWQASTGYGTPGEENSTPVGIENIPPLTADLVAGVSPNPFSTSAMLRIRGEQKLTDGQLTIYDFHGEIVRRMDHIFARNILLERGDLPAGLYIFKLQEISTGRMTTGKFIIQ